MAASKGYTAIRKAVRISTSNCRGRKRVHFLHGTLGDEGNISYVDIAFTGVGIPKLWDMIYGYDDAWMLRDMGKRIAGSRIHRQYMINDSLYSSSSLSVSELMLGSRTSWSALRWQLVVSHALPKWCI